MIHVAVFDPRWTPIPILHVLFRILFNFALGILVGVKFAGKSFLFGIIIVALLNVVLWIFD